MVATKRKKYEIQQRKPRKAGVVDIVIHINDGGMRATDRRYSVWAVTGGVVLMNNWTEQPVRVFKDVDAAKEWFDERFDRYKR